MTMHRRILAKPTAAPAVAALREQIENGEKTMRKVWRAGKTGRHDPYWYVEAFTREGAINFIARQFKEPAAHFDSTKDSK